MHTQIPLCQQKIHGRARFVWSVFCPKKKKIINPAIELHGIYSGVYYILFMKSKSTRYSEVYSLK